MKTWWRTFAKVNNMSSPRDDANRLIASIERFDRVVVAFSGGVDSSVVVAAAARSRCSSVLAVTADSPSVPRWQLTMARQIAGEVGVDHQIVSTGEVELASYRQNDHRRCFHCKETLYRELALVAGRHAGATILSGTNTDDLSDYRPGLEAGRKMEVVTPLADLGMGKTEVRSVAAHFGLSNQSLPASPCLASRIAYGTEVTAERLSRVERAEAWLRRRGFDDLRVRLHAGELARIEVPRHQRGKLLELDDSGELTTVMKEYGFQFVTIDLQGLQTGSLNRLIAIGPSQAGKPGRVQSSEEYSPEEASH